MHGELEEPEGILIMNMNMNNKLTVENISKLLADLARSHFWGQVQIDYQDGQPVVVHKNQTFKTLEGNNSHGNSVSR